jgi:hypothetical protein
MGMSLYPLFYSSYASYRLVVLLIHVGTNPNVLTAAVLQLWILLSPNLIQTSLQQLIRNILSSCLTVAGGSLWSGACVWNKHNQAFQRKLLRTREGPMKLSHEYRDRLYQDQPWAERGCQQVQDHGTLEKLQMKVTFWNSSC